MAVLLPIIGVTMGVMTLITVLSGMNGFQSLIIDGANEVLSYHVRIEGKEVLNEEFLNKLMSQKEVRAVVPFRDIPVLAGVAENAPQIVVARAVDPKAFLSDEGLMANLTILHGEAAPTNADSLVMGGQTARKLGIIPGDSVELMTLTINEFGSPVRHEETFTLSGIFTTSYYEVENGYVFISDDSPLNLEKTPLIYGIKTKKLNDDFPLITRIKEAVESEGAMITSWRRFNSAIFNALKTEKTMLLLLVSLIFIVMAVHIHQNLKRSAYERSSEIALLRALGCSRGVTHLYFILQGTLIGVISVIIGGVLGLILSYNINRLLAVINIYLLKGGYLPGIPVRVMSGDVIMVTLSALLSCFLAGAIAARRLSRLEPATVLRGG